jgi:general secretion pathway protein I
MKLSLHHARSRSPKKTLSWRRPPFLVSDPSSGFTLLEVMMAIALMAIALTAVFGSQSQSLLVAGDAKFNTTAPFLAQSKMAEIEAEGGEDLTSGSGDFGEDFPGYLWELEVADVASVGPEGASDHLRLVDLVVSWEEDNRYQFRLRSCLFVPETE